MGRKNRRTKDETFYDEELLLEFAKQESMRTLKIDGPKKTDSNIRSILPLTENQQITFDEYSAGHNLVLHGVAGSGKTFISLYLALRDVLAKKYKKAIIVRSIVPTREIGHLPGTIEEKVEVYQLPYIDICRKLFDYEDAYIKLQKREMIEFVTTSFIRGVTLDDSIVIVDEASNLSFHELDSIITRLGKDSKIIFCGDVIQSDLKGRERDGFNYFMEILSRMQSFRSVEFGKDDIVRSALVKEYIIARDKLE